MDTNARKCSYVEALEKVVSSKPSALYMFIQLIM